MITLLALLALAWFGKPPLPNTTIAGAGVPNGGSLHAFLAERARTWRKESLLLRTGFHVWRPTRAELGAELPVSDAMNAIAGLGRSSNPVVAARDLWTAYVGPGHALRWRPQITNERTLDTYLANIRAEVDRLPFPGSYGPGGQPIAGMPGEALDLEATKRAIHRAIARNSKELVVATLVTPPPRAPRRFARNDASAATVLMMRQETHYRGSNRGRATNIELAAAKLDRTIVMPGEELSFNEIVGKREPARGFAPSLELLGGELVMGVGGGVCQVAGTLHAAAFFAGLIIDEYRPHSRLNEFAYLRPGLDTMVAWPDHVRDLAKTKDMRIRNPYPFPILVRVLTLGENAGTRTLRVELFGTAKPYRVEWSFEEIAEIPAAEVRRRDPSLRSGEEQLQQEASPGLVILRRRTIYTPERRIEEERKVTYPPVPRILRTGSG